MKYSNDASGFVILSEYVPDIIEEVRYHTTYNFIGDKIDGYDDPIILVVLEAALALQKANEEAKKLGYAFKVYDAYRPQTAVDHFVRWAKDINDTRMKEIFYPETKKEELFEKGFIASKSGHTRGSSIDLTLFNLKTGKEVDMGGVFDNFGDVSHSSYTEGLTEEQINNRKLLHKIMTENGFKGINSEWWHFNLIDEPYPDTYFTFPIDKNLINKQK
ncbi:MAG: M15 family metallopeptidase [Bacilli bacterium]|nr:M15 family metallopeptidase [Bacilli bacterium]OLA05206.1 MAG: peptidase M15 [Coprobacillus sp. 28_7]